jgi:hypothetical protein
MHIPSLKNVQFKSTNEFTSEFRSSTIDESRKIEVFVRSQAYKSASRNADEEQIHNEMSSRAMKVSLCVRGFRGILCFA